tara:strand:- start:730 stop:1683 length:954 start_codon:yes stop_codon:yes gene_type:complete
MNQLKVVKYKPVSFEDFNLNSFSKILMNKLIETSNINLLIWGNIGSGKSSLINVILNHYYNNDNDIINNHILYISLLKDQGINYYRNDVKNFCQTSYSIKNKKKTIVIDDMDLLNEQSQQIFNNFINNYKNINFIISCSDMLKINNNIKNKLEIINIENIDKIFLSKILDNILINENIDTDIECKKYLLNLSNYSISNLINYIEKVLLINENINIKLLKNISCNVLFDDYNNYIDLCVKNDLENAIAYILNIYDKGYSVIDILDGLVLYIKQYSNIDNKNKYEIIKILCKYINIFYNIHEENIELIFMTNNIINTLN